MLTNKLCRPVWRIAPMGVTQCYLSKSPGPDGIAHVNSQGQRTKWALQATRVRAEDLFDTEREARVEYRRRKALVLACSPLAHRDMSSPEWTKTIASYAEVGHGVQHERGPA
jgi:hypothetical protein